MTSILRGAGRRPVPVGHPESVTQEPHGAGEDIGNLNQKQAHQVWELARRCKPASWTHHLPGSARGEGRWNTCG